MTTEPDKKISKSLSYVLRHRPDTLGIELDSAGWIDVERLLAAFAQQGKVYSHALLERVVADNNKQRFEFSDDGTQIRARQGHSVTVDLGYAPATPPAVLYHGTATRFLDAILREGLTKQKRHHVHLSTDQATMMAVAQRHGKPVMLQIDTAGMLAAGHTFFVTDNAVWLTEAVPPAFLTQVQATHR